MRRLLLLFLFLLPCPVWAQTVMYTNQSQSVPANHNFTGNPNFAGNPTLSGSPTISGPLTLSGPLVASNSATFAGSVTFNGPVTGLTSRTLFSASFSSPSNSATRYVGLTHSMAVAPSATENYIDGTLTLMVRAGVFENFQCIVNAAPGAGKSWTITLRQAGPAVADSALVCLISEGNVSCPVQTGSVPFAASTIWDLKIVPAGTPAGTGFLCGLSALMP